MTTPKIKEKILLIDDEEACLVSGKLMLEGVGYQVVALDSGREALEFLKSEHHTIAVILLDLMMPDIDGLEFLDRLTKELNLKNIPIIIQTGISEGKEINQAMAKGAVGCIRKPYSAEDMKSQIEKVLPVNAIYSL